ncbi:MAG: CRISPR-associated DxTHG motif protein [Flavobacteriales bacterium]|nr:CRISPR-associated DxTHG motif protein [Flavobacteriales bacterium]
MYNFEFLGILVTHGFRFMGVFSISSAI